MSKGGNLKNKTNKKITELDVNNYNNEECYNKKKVENAIRFVFISDTHGKIQNLSLPQGDVLIHCGDFTNICTTKEVEIFNEYLGTLSSNYKFIIVISGNHEKKFDSSLTGSKPNEMRKKLTNCLYLQDENIEILGFKIHGTPWQPQFRANGAFALQRKPEKALEKWNLIPDDTNILVSHTPPLGAGDRTKYGIQAGCPFLPSVVQERVKPIIHAFGHIHEAYGMWTDNTTIYVNAAICGSHFEMKNKPIVLDLVPPSKGI